MDFIPGKTSPDERNSKMKSGIVVPKVVIKQATQLDLNVGREVISAGMIGRKMDTLPEVSIDSGISNSMDFETKMDLVDIIRKRKKSKENK